MIITIDEKAFGGQSKVRDWYVVRWPSDDLGPEINGGLTFQDLYEGLQTGDDVYVLLGVGDSIVRERVFDALATMMECSYDHIYYRWLNNGPDGPRVFYDDLKGLRFRDEVKTTEKVYMVIEDTWTGNICSTSIEGVFKSVDGANKRIQELIPYEKARMAGTGTKLTNAEVEQVLKDHGIEYKFFTCSDGQIDFTIENKPDDITTFLKIAERTLED